MQLGQALSIRPDILSPAAMNELQKLCDKVPSFNSGDAMQVIADELGAPWHQARPSPPACNTLSCCLHPLTQLLRMKLGCSGQGMCSCLPMY